MSDTASEGATPSSGATPEATPDVSAAASGDTSSEDLGESARRAIAALRRENRSVTERLTAERDAALARVADFETANDSEAEKLRGKLGRVEKDLAEANAELSLRDRRDAAREAAGKAGIPEWWDRLQGDTPEELEADAHRIAERVNPARPVSDLGAGPRGSAAEPRMDSLIRRRAGRGS